MGALIFGLTGGIGSGKSSVADIFRGAGVPVVDADQIAREAVVVGTRGLRRVVTEFGPGIVDSDGSLDRKALASIVFHDAGARERLNAIVHPEVKRLAHARFRDLETHGATLIGYEIPLLFETNQQDAFRPVIVVDTTVENQVARTMARDGCAREEAQARIDAQLPLREKVRRADWVIENNEGRRHLKARSLEVLRQMQGFETS